MNIINNHERMRKISNATSKYIYDLKNYFQNVIKESENDQDNDFQDKKEELNDNTFKSI